MNAAIIFVHIWGVLELTWLGTLRRTVRLRTILLALLAGVYICGPLALFLQFMWIHLSAVLTGASMYDAKRVAGYTVDPFIEEFVKIAPLIVILRLTPARSRWTITDCILIGAACGAGFGLMEMFLLHSAIPHMAMPDERGWTLTSNISLPHVTGFVEGATSWLPAAVATSEQYMGLDPLRQWVNPHLVWSALAGFAVGLIGLHRSAVAWLVGGLLFFLIGADHAAFNADVGTLVYDVLVPPFSRIGPSLPWMPVLALAVAFWLDHQTVPAEAQLLLREETAASPRALGLLSTMAARPFFMVRIFDFVRRRRIFYRLSADKAADADALRADLLARRAVLSGPSPRPAAVAFPTPTQGLATPVGALTVVAALPWIFWFIVGGWPQTASIQATMTSGFGWTLVRVASLIAAALMLRQLLAAVRAWSLLRERADGEDTAELLLRGGAALGGLATLVLAFKSQLSGGGSGAEILSFHIAAAADRVRAASGFAIGGLPSSLPGPGEAAGRPGEERQRQPGPWADNYDFGDQFDGGASHDPSEYGPPSAGQSVQPPSEPPRTMTPPTGDPRKTGYDIGRSGGMPQNLGGATREYQTVYDAGYAAGRKEKREADAFKGRGAREMRPGEMEEREISFLGDDGQSTNTRTVKGSKEYLDWLEEEERQKIAAMILKGLLGAGGKIGAPNAPKPGSKKDLGGR